MKFITFLNTGIFPATIMFSNGFSYDEITSYLRKNKAFGWLKGISGDKELIDGGNWFALYRSVTERSGRKIEYYYLIFKEQFKFNDYNYCKLAHEVLHICQFLLPDILDRNREYECEAYLHTHIMQQCLKHLRNRH